MFIDYVYKYVIDNKLVLPFRFIMDRSFTYMEETRFLKKIKRKNVRFLMKEILYNIPTDAVSEVPNIEIDKRAKTIIELFYFPVVQNSIWDWVFSKFSTEIVTFISAISNTPIYIIEEIDKALKFVEYGEQLKFDGFWHMFRTAKELQSAPKEVIQIMKDMLKDLYVNGNIPFPYSDQLYELGYKRLSISVYRIINRSFVFPQYDYELFNKGILSMALSWRDNNLRDVKTWLIDYPYNF